MVQAANSRNLKAGYCAVANNLNNTISYELLFGDYQYSVTLDEAQLLAMQRSPMVVNNNLTTNPVPNF